MTARNTPAGKTCDLCGGDDFEEVCRQDRRGNPLTTELCRRCGLVSHQDIPSETELASFYGTQYRQQYHGESTPSDHRVMRAWKNGARIFRQIAPHLQNGDQVLEVGAGIGCTVKYFETQGYTASGVEPHGGFCSFGVQRLGVPLAHADLFELSDTAAFDVVLLVHVIEHFRSPAAALHNIHRLLKPGGRLYVECPNLNAPFAPRRKMFHFAHIHNFTPMTLAMLARRCGFEVLTTFASERSDNMRTLLRRSDAVDAGIDPASYPFTRSALHRHNLLSYHLRWEYLTARSRRITRNVYERLTARAYVRSLLKRHSAERVQAAPPRVRHAAA